MVRMKTLVRSSVSGDRVVGFNDAVVGPDVERDTTITGPRGRSIERQVEIQRNPGSIDRQVQIKRPGGNV